jgi:F1F0 ATPase subunit 2
MNEKLLTIFAAPAGLVTGCLFFGGLYFTVKRGLTASNPVFWFLPSFIIRIGLTLAGFWFFSSGSWERLMLCFAGFMTARFFITKFLTYPKEETHEN